MKGRNFSPSSTLPQKRINPKCFTILLFVLIVVFRYPSLSVYKHTAYAYARLRRGLLIANRRCYPHIVAVSHKPFGMVFANAAVSAAQKPRQPFGTGIIAYCDVLRP
jgi:hypothetical protein